jgi:hypothetical protein
MALGLGAKVNKNLRFEQAAIGALPKFRLPTAESRHMRKAMIGFQED